MTERKRDGKGRFIKSDIIKPSKPKYDTAARSERMSRPETREKISKAAKERWADPISRAKQLAAINSPEAKQKSSEKQKGKKRPWNRETNIRLFKGKKRSANFCKAVSEGKKKKFTDPELCKAHSERAKKQWQDPDIRKSMITPNIGRKRSQEYCERARKIHKEIWDTHPEKKKQYSEMAKKQWASEEARKKNGERIRQAFINTLWYGDVKYNDDLYCEKFNAEFKERVRAYWNYICFECGTPQNGRKLGVHHIHYDKKMCCNGSPQDVVPLCDHCHGKCRCNKDFWEDHFTELLYAYNPDGKCFFTKEEMKAYCQTEV